MNFSFNLYAYICSATGVGFNEGYLVGDKYYAHATDAADALSQCKSFTSMERAIKDGIADTVKSTEIVDMDYIQHMGGPILAISNLFVDRSEFNRAVSEIYYHEGLLPKFLKIPVCPNCGSNDVHKGGIGYRNERFNRFDFEPSHLPNDDFCSNCDSSTTLEN